MPDEIKYSNYFLAFIDILGQKEAFAGLSILPQDLNDEAFRTKLIAAHRETVYFVDNFRKSFEEFISSFVLFGKSSDHVREEKKELYLELTKCNIEYQRFSDCIQVYQCLETQKHHAPILNAVFGILAACGGMMVIALSQKKVFRAGVDIGFGTKLENGEVYGPALFKAYELENKIANYPRIVIGPQVINYLMNLSHKNPQTQNPLREDLEICKRGADRCLAMIEKDEDGYFILDYLGEEFRRFEDNMGSKATQYSELYRSAFSFTKSELEKWRRKGDDKLVDKYERLYNYFQRKGYA